jgi:hypothetical protein
MTRLKGKHPRKPGWAHFQCDECQESFWGPDIVDGPKGLHYCVDCRPESTSNTHFTGGHDTPADVGNRAYHGGRFHSGEW